MKTIRYAVVLAVLLVLLGVYSFSTNEKPFTLTVVDASGRAVPYVQVSSDNGIVCYANDRGDVSWSESSLMNRRVHFSVDTPGYSVPHENGIIVVHGRHTELRVSRTSKF
jgi:hypothetical protein